MKVVLDRDGHADGINHGLDAVGHQLRLGHQAGTKSAALHALAGTATVDVDFFIAPLLAQAGAVRQISRLAAAQLKRHRMFLGIEA